MPATRAPCETGGQYISDCRCRTRSFLAIGFYFPTCFACGKPVEWTPILGENERREASPLHEQ